MFAFGFLNAQYYQNTNNSGGTDRIADGTNITAGGQGHLIAASTNVLGTQDLLLTRTNANGTIGGLNTFNQVYRLLTPNNQPLNAEPVKILQVGNGRICVVGNYYSTFSPTPSGIFTAVLNSGGGVISAVGWQTVSPGASQAIFATSACRAISAVSNNVYISAACDATVPGNGARALLIAINGSTNALIWGRIYDFNLPYAAAYKFIPRDLVASPYQPSLVPELFVVGQVYDDQGNDEGFDFRVNINTGAVVGNVTTFDTGKFDDFVAVTVASGLGGGGNGFAIAGHNYAYGSRQPMVMKVDQTGGGVRWANNYKYTGGNESYAADIIQRQNTSGQWTFYLSTTPDFGLFGGRDMVAVLIDDLGVAQVEWTYGTAADEYAAEISSFTGTPSDGITVFGNINYAVGPDFGDVYYVKAYYNGVTACNVTRDAPPTDTYSLSRVSRPFFATGNVGGSTLLLNVQLPASVTQICFAVTIAGGNNARTAETQESNAVSSTLYPNPVSLSAPVLSLNLNSATEQQIEIRITDMLGREVLNQQISIAEGQSVQQIQLPSGLSAGVYSMSISGNNVSENHRFIIE